MVLISIIVILLNLSLLVVVIRNRQVLSIEGMALSFTALMLAIELFRVAISGFQGSRDAVEDWTYPGVCLAIGIGCLWAGLAVSDARPAPIRLRTYGGGCSRSVAIRAGVGLMVQGCVMAIVFMASENIWTPAQYLEAMERLQVEPRNIGSFLDRWSALVFVGSGALVASSSWRAATKAIVVMATLLIAFLFTPSKASLVFGTLAIAIPIASLNPRMWTRLLRPVPVAVVLLVSIVSIGIKTQIRYSAKSLSRVNYSADTVFGTSVAVLDRRYGSGSLMQGYGSGCHRSLWITKLFGDHRVDRSFPPPPFKGNLDGRRMAAVELEAQRLNSDKCDVVGRVRWKGQIGILQNFEIETVETREREFLIGAKHRAREDVRQAIPHLPAAGRVGVQLSIHGVVGEEDLEGRVVVSSLKLAVRIITFPVLKVIGWIGEKAIDAAFTADVFHHAVLAAALLGLKQIDDLPAQFRLHAVSHLDVHHRKSLTRFPELLRE